MVPKYDGYRLRVERDGDRVRLITRGRYDWTKRFPWITEAAMRNRQKRFVIDGEAVILGVDGISDFSALHAGKHNTEVQLCAFDVLAIDGDDVRARGFDDGGLDASDEALKMLASPVIWRASVEQRKVPSASARQSMCGPPAVSYLRLSWPSSSPVLVVWTDPE